MASGLNPPFAGANAFEHVKAYVDGIILVTDEEIIQAVDLLFRHGLVVEPSGAAALTAVLTGRVRLIRNLFDPLITISCPLPACSWSKSRVAWRGRA